MCARVDVNRGEAPQTTPGHGGGGGRLKRPFCGSVTYDERPWFHLTDEMGGWRPPLAPLLGERTGGPVVGEKMQCETQKRSACRNDELSAEGHFTARKRGAAASYANHASHEVSRRASWRRLQVAGTRW